MKKEFKLTLVALALTALCGCSFESDVNTPDLPQGEAISFGNVSTRAVDEASDIEEFSVWATVSSVGSNAVSYLPLLGDETGGERVYRNPAGSNTWAYDNVQYWLPNSIFHFFAAYPHGIGFNMARAEMNGTYYTAYSLEVTADGSADTEDILIAENITNTNVEGYNRVVPLSFSHLLTKINLTISQNTDIDSEFEYYVTKVTITGLNGNGVYNVLPINEMFYKGWDMENSTPITLGKNYESDPVCLREPDGDGRESKPLKVWGDDGVMLIPHEIAQNGVQIRVDYLYDVNPDDDDLGSPRFVEGYIPAITWQSNTSINYNIAIANSSFISFSQPTIVPWGSPQTGGTIIIK